MINIYVRLLLSSTPHLANEEEKWRSLSFFFLSLEQTDGRTTDAGRVPRGDKLRAQCPVQLVSGRSADDRRPHRAKAKAKAEAKANVGQSHLIDAARLAPTSLAAAHFPVPEHNGGHDTFGRTESSKLNSSQRTNLSCEKLQLPSANCELRAASCELRTANCERREKISIWGRGGSKLSASAAAQIQSGVINL